jgi:mRNA interferase MazF
MTTTMADAPTTRVAIPTTTGITQPSFAMIDKITTVRRSHLGARIGRVPTTLMADIERSLMVFLGLAS